MAIAQTGTTLTFPALGSGNSGTVSTTITVPADAEIVVVGWSGFEASGTFYSTGKMQFTKGGVDTDMVNVTEGCSTGSFWSAPLYYLTLPDTGSNKTLKWDWAGAGAAGDVDAMCSVTFWKGIDTSSPVRSTGGTQAVSTPFATATMTAQTDDLIVAWAAGYYAGGGEGSIASWTNATLLSQLTASGVADGAWATNAPTGNVSVAAATDVNWDDGGIAAIVLKPATAGDVLHPQGVF